MKALLFDLRSDGSAWVANYVTGSRAYIVGARCLLCELAGVGEGEGLGILTCGRVSIGCVARESVHGGLATDPLQAVPFSPWTSWKPDGVCVLARPS